MNPSRNLVLVHSPGLQARSDFETFRINIEEKAPDIEVFIVENGQRHSVTTRRAARRPALIFSPVALIQFRPLSGKILAGKHFSKTEELDRMRACGVRTPDYTVLTPETRLDPAVWGEFIVVKPQAGRQGAGIRLHRTQDVQWTDPETWPADDPRFGQELYAQKFVDTGAYSKSHRVLTVLGRPIYSIISRATEPRADLDDVPTGPVDLAVASNSAERVIELNFEEDVIEFAKVVAQAFPDQPALGIDIVRDEKTGDLYALEVNARGFVWHFSSNYGLAQVEKYGLDLVGQFGALDTITDALIDATRRHAE